MSDIKFSACIEMIFNDLPILERIDAVAKAGLPAFEFWGWRNKDLPAIIERAAQNNLRIAGFTADCGNDLCDPEMHRDWVKGAADGIDQAVAAGASALIITTGNEMDSIPREQQHEAIVESLKAIAPHAEENNITLCLEPLNILVDHAGYYLVTSKEGFAVIDEVNSPNVKLLYDIYHQQISEGNVIATIRENIQRIGHFHVADVPGRREPGTGEINYENVFAAIAESDYAGFVGLEFRPSTTSAEALAQVLKIAGQA